MGDSKANPLAALKRIIELCMPDLRGYYRVVRKARVVKTYASDGRYWADVQPLRNDESDDPKEPVVPKVEIPILWAGPDRGVVCPPLEGSLCDLEYYDGDPNYPRISNFRWQGNKAPVCEVGAFIVQKQDGTSIKIDAENNIVTITPANAVTGIGGNKSETIGGTWTIEAPMIVLRGNITSSGAGGGVGTVSEKSARTHQGSYTLTGDLHVTGNITCTGTITGHHVEG